MIIKTSEIKGATIKEVIDELYNNEELMNEISGLNLRGGDFIESVATTIVYDDIDVDTSALWDYCR